MFATAPPWKYDMLYHCSAILRSTECVTCCEQANNHDQEEKSFMYSDMGMHSLHVLILSSKGIAYAANSLKQARWIIVQLFA